MSEDIRSMIIRNQTVEDKAVGVTLHFNKRVLTSRLGIPPLCLTEMARLMDLKQLSAEVTVPHRLRNWVKRREMDSHCI